MTPKRTKSIPDGKELRGMLDDLDDAMADMMGLVKDPDAYSRSDSHSSNPFTTDDDSSSSLDSDADSDDSDVKRKKAKR